MSVIKQEAKELDKLVTLHGGFDMEIKTNNETVKVKVNNIIVGLNPDNKIIMTSVDGDQHYSSEIQPNQLIQTLTTLIGEYVVSKLHEGYKGENK